MAILVSWLIRFIASQKFNDIQLLLYSFDYCAQGLTLLGYLHIIFKLASIEIQVAPPIQGSTPTEQGDGPRVNNFSEHVFENNEDEDVEYTAISEAD